MPGSVFDASLGASRQEPGLPLRCHCFVACASAEPSSWGRVDVFRDERQLPSAASKVKVGELVGGEGLPCGEVEQYKGRSVAVARGGMGFRIRVRIWMSGCITV